jgi:hypothetical protein
MIVMHHAHPPPVHLLHPLLGQFRHLVRMNGAIHAHRLLEHRRHKAHIVRHDHQRQPLVQPAHQFVKFILHRGIEIGGGLVEQQQLRFAGQRPGDQHALPLPPGQRGEGPTCQRLHPHFRQCIPGHRPIRRAIRPPCGPVPQPSHQHHIKHIDRECLIDPRVLRHVSHPPPSPSGVLPQDANRSAPRAQQTQQQAQQGRLASAVRPDHASQVAGLHGQIDVFEHRRATVAERQIAHFDHRGGHGAPASVAGGAGSACSS